MFRAIIDTPWAYNATEDSYTAEIVLDPTHGGNIKQCRDVTGDEGIEVSPGRVLRGGNYPKASGIKADHDQGRVGGSGDPDYLTVEVITETEQQITDIGNDPSDKYMVLWWEEIVSDSEQPATHNKNEIPSAAQFGQWRAKMARRGVPQSWIDENLGEDTRGRTRKQIDSGLRRGYILHQT